MGPFSFSNLIGVYFIPFPRRVALLLLLSSSSTLSNLDSLFWLQPLPYISIIIDFISFFIYIYIKKKKRKLLCNKLGFLSSSSSLFQEPSLYKKSLLFLSLQPCILLTTTTNLVILSIPLPIQEQQPTNLVVLCYY